MASPTRRTSGRRGSDGAGAEGSSAAATASGGRSDRAVRLTLELLRATLERGHRLRAVREQAEGLDHLARAPPFLGHQEPRGVGHALDVAQARGLVVGDQAYAADAQGMLERSLI